MRIPSVLKKNRWKLIGLNVSPQIIFPIEQFSTCNFILFYNTREYYQSDIFLKQNLNKNGN